MGVKSLFLLLKNAGIEWVNDNATRLSAALAYYAVFSIAPLLVIVVYIVGLVFGKEAAEGQIASQMSGLFGSNAAEFIQSLVAATATSSKSTGLWAALISIGILLFGASTVFGELKNALNSIWGVESGPGHAVYTFFRDRLLSFSLVLIVGFLLLTSLIASSVIAAFSASLATVMPLSVTIWKGVDLVLSISLTSSLFAMIFKILPNVILTWRQVFPGAILTALLFTLGKGLLAWYLGTTSSTSTFGAAGSLIVILLWVYYVTGIMFFGAEFTKVYVREYGGGIVPHRHSRLIVSALSPGLPVRVVPAGVDVRETRIKSDSTPE